ncbi:hypothetical protein BDB00DRAFT_799310 [Zychaea mexicana]|uniref:uncharacterized protein n=1 Tax=Zychaea mexicana TaxID=64656 RepID=UPI0022FE9650|nr:uncharacterized protein BDB00DRAFT_799310 [Zychaea mexicana]KAI9498736.1 hypothetical protein BDB00DRAFT_799310 [Zychaea mexicana]
MTTMDSSPSTTTASSSPAPTTTTADSCSLDNSINDQQRGMKRKRISSCIILMPEQKQQLQQRIEQHKNKSVRFMDHPTIEYTYSADEYDRGGLFDHVTLYKFNPPPPVAPPKLSVNIPPFVLRRDHDDDQDSASSTEPSPDTPSDHDATAAVVCGSLQSSPTPFLPPQRRSKQDRPKLSVDTSICAGPLFFTKLSTNHRSASSSSFSLSNKLATLVDNNGDDDSNSNSNSNSNSSSSNHSFLVPMSALPV